MRARFTLSCVAPLPSDPHWLMPTTPAPDLVRAHLLASSDLMRRTAASAAEDLGRAAVLVADSLRVMGYTNAISLDGGWRAWQAAGLPVKKD